ncbi:uncharacterized protein ACRADG_010943 [Cochliomyia hominivorax]
MEQLIISFGICGLVVIATLVYVLLWNRLQFWHRRGIPYKKPSLLLGNLQSFVNNRHITEAFLDVYRQFKGTGPFAGFYFLMKPSVIIMDLDLIKNVLIKDFNNFEDRGMYYNERDDPLTGHLFNLETAGWRKLRSKLTPTFTSGKMKLMFSTVSQIGGECAFTLENLLKTSCEVDVKELMARYTTDVIGTCVLGLDCNCLKDPEAEVRVMNKNILTNFRHSKVVHLFMQLLPQVAKAFRMKELLDITNDFYFKVVRETIAYREQNNVKRNDFINLLMEMKNSLDDKKRLNMNEITANVFVFFMAGYETSATTMAFALYEMALNPEVQEKLREEILQVLDKYNQEITYESIKEMQYLKQVLQETMRKYTVLPFLQRKAKLDYDTKVPGYIIPRNTLAIIPIHAIHNDPEIFPEPHKFRPERFDAQEVAERHPLAWLPFGDGPRNCIGLRFGKMQTAVGLVSVLRNYKFSVSEKTPIPVVINPDLPLLTPLGELFLKVEKICEIPQKLRKEIETVLENCEQEFSYECMKDIKYLEQIIAVAPALFRKSTKSYETSDPLYFIDKNTMIIILSLSYHHNPDYFPNPEKFDPERFSRLNLANIKTCSYLPSGEGPRNCIGMRFGRMQTAIGLVQLIRNFQFNICHETKIPVEFILSSFNLNPQDGRTLKISNMIFGFLIICLFVILAYGVYVLKQRYKYWQNLGIPCEEPSFIFGNITGVGTKRSFTDVWHEFYDKYKHTGPFVGFYWFFNPAVFVVDPALLKQILIKDFSKFVDRGFYVNEEDDPLSGMLFNLEGNKWRHMRNKLSPTFTSGKMKMMFPIIINISGEFVKVFDQAVKENDVIEVSDLMARFTTDVIGSCAFGLEMSSLKDPNNKFRMMGRKSIVEQRYGRLGIAFRNSFPNLARKLHMKDTLQDVEDFFMGIVKDTVRYREENNVKRNDFMDMLIDLKNNKLMKSENGEELTNLTLEEIAAQAFVFLVAGFETSSTTMGFALYELAQHQDIQQKAREEVLEVLEKHNQEFTYEAMKEMVYLEQVLLETLRLHSVLPLITRVASEDYTVPGHPKYVIKKDMLILIPSGCIQRDERYYSNPLEFNPDHFTADKVAERDSVLYMPFGDGPRICIGMRFGKMQALVGLAVLLKNFKFSVCEKTQIPLKYDKNNFLCSSEKGVHLRVTKINSTFSLHKLTSLSGWVSLITNIMGVLIILLTIILLLVLYFLYALRKHFKYWQNMGIGCDDPSWIFGSFKGAVTERTFIDIFQDHYYKYKDQGPFSGFYWFFRQAVFVTDLSLIKQILIKDFNKFSDRGLFVNEEDDPLSGHLFNLEGQKWRILRSKLSPTFTSGKMKFMFPTVVMVAHELVQAFGQLLEKESKVEIRDIVSRYTTDVIGNCAFGLECNSLKDPQAKFHIMSKRALLENHLGNFGVAFRFSFPKLALRLRMRDTVHEIEDFFMGIVKATVKYREENQIKRNDFMNLLLELKNNKIMKTESGEELTNLSIKEVAAQAFIFLVAGSDTSSTTMSFALYELALNEDVQIKAREEVNRVLQKHNGEFTYECMSEMKYLDQVVQETLRLYTPLPALNRVALEDYVVPGHPNFVIKKDMPVVIPAICIHRDEKYFPNPLKFNPDNFSAEQVALRDSVLYLPFGEGPRNCIGSRFGKMQILIGLALLLKNYKFSTCSETLIPMKYDKENFMLTPDGNLYLKAERV